MEFHPQIKKLVPTYNQNIHYNMIYWWLAMFVKHVKCEHKIRAKKTTFGKCSIRGKVDPCLIFSFNIVCTHNDTRWRQLYKQKYFQHILTISIAKIIALNIWKIVICALCYVLHINSATIFFAIQQD
jgi:hypothetical protein